MKKQELAKLIIDFEFEGLSIDDVEVLLKDYLVKDCMRNCTKDALEKVAYEYGLLEE